MEIPAFRTIGQGISNRPGDQDDEDLDDNDFDEDPDADEGDDGLVADDQ